MRVLTSLVPVLLLAAPAVAATVMPPPATPRHGYVLGRYAAASDQLGLAAQLFDDARQRDPTAPELRRRAFDLALAAGDWPRTVELARELQAAGAGNSEIAMVRLADAVLKRDWAGVDTARPLLKDAGYAIVVLPITEAWTRYGRGDVAGGLALLDPATFSGFSRSYIAEQRAHMLAAAGRWQEAAALYAELRAGTAAGINFLRQGEADALAQGGDRDGALKLLAADDPTLAPARARLLAGKRIGALAPDPRRGIGWMAARLAADLARERPVPLALLFARLASQLAPDLPAAWLITGDVLARGGQRDAALAAYARIPAGDALADAAAARRAEVLAAAGRDAEAGRLLATAAEAATARAEDWTRLGDWHRRGDRFAAAATAYGKAIERSGSAVPWSLLFLRGSMRERAGDWAGAEADLRAALALAPQEPILLNYLGYSLLDRGERVEEAGSLIERAAALKPEDGGIIDSLGWSLFRRGRYDEAVTRLEKAASLEPDDATISSHLGDAYWQVGRRIEARFRWRAALDLDPTPAERTSLAAKLDYGFDAATVMRARP